MRIIKLSKDDADFTSRVDVASFFDDELYRRSPIGKFEITPRKRRMPDIRKGTLLLFSYQTHCMYIARSAGPVAQVDPRSRQYDPKWPAYFVLNMNTLKPISARLHDYEKALRKATGLKRNLVRDRGWPFLENRYEPPTLKFFHSPLKPLPAVDDLDPPPGTNTPDRALSTHWSYRRDRNVREYVLRRAKGRCEFCKKNGFLLPNGRRYLETHHIIALAKDGADTPKNVMALCPSHHREAHYGEEAVRLEIEMVEFLRVICRRSK